ncbi:dihydrofolate reductase [Paenibacillus albicereus]|uniref:Dihydrofolate reductase n=1 Tax=Paenibacillus albicereus TaxID=2726185 RepID=A0A6H2GXZ5_9BACL|nr:dihydrofolate reductase [Paenibacillus albicereus]QJC52046.1 dihydrofolate reductase [Paenibacillus albicereus]
MRITMIACMDRDRLIGRGNDLPWKLPEDMRFFKEQTMGKPVLMGRKTFESFGSRPLKGRRNLLLSRGEGEAPAGTELFRTPEEALQAVAGEEELMVIGGEQVYRLLLSRADRLLLTEIDRSYGGGDAYFPELPEGEWELADSAAGLEQGPQGETYAFQTYVRKALARKS